MQLGLQCLQSGLQKYMSFYNISATLAEEEECTGLLALLLQANAVEGKGLMFCWLITGLLIGAQNTHLLALQSIKNLAVIWQL
jgi:hypothetical protein